MLNTLAECSKELTRIDAEIARLTLERNHVLAVRDFLGKKRNGFISPKQMKAQILEIITANPGIDGQNVREALPDNPLPRTVTFQMSDLRKAGKIENRGARGRGARWYIKE